MEHNGAPTKFKVNIVGKYFDALTRQANEGVRIYKNPSLVINSKSEFNHPPVKRLELKIVLKLMKISLLIPRE